MVTLGGGIVATPQGILSTGLVEGGLPHEECLRIHGSIECLTNDALVEEGLSGVCLPRNDDHLARKRFTMKRRLVEPTEPTQEKLIGVDPILIPIECIVHEVKEPRKILWVSGLRRCHCLLAGYVEIPFRSNIHHLIGIKQNRNRCGDPP